MQADYIRINHCLLTFINLQWELQYPPLAQPEDVYPLWYARSSWQMHYNVKEFYKFTSSQCSQLLKKIVTTSNLSDFIITLNNNFRLIFPWQLVYYTYANFCNACYKFHFYMTNLTITAYECSFTLSDYFLSALTDAFSRLKPCYLLHSQCLLK